jgi:hypothetical protein
MASIAGTYFTSWEYDIPNQAYQLGPIVVIGTDNSVAVDGVTMSQAMVSGTMVSWSSAAGNPSSAMLVFQIGSTPNPTTFTGTYWMSGDDTPAGTNLYGFDSQPQAPLSTWANTYSSYEVADGNNESLGTLVISGTGTAITFAGTTIDNPIYTGVYDSTTQQDTNELAWFTTDGNENNVAISFFSQDDSFNFNGDIWAAGANRPVGPASTANNFFGTTQSTADADAVDDEANLAHAAEMAAIGIALQVMAGAGAAVGTAMMNMGAGGNEGNAQVAQEVAQNVEHNAAPAEANAADAGAGDVGEAGDALDDLEELAEDVGEDLLEAVAGGVAQTPGTPPPGTRGRRSKDTSGLSAKELLNLKSAKGKKSGS